MKKIITSISLSSLLIFSVYSSEESQITQLLQKSPASNSSKLPFLSSIENMTSTEKILIAAVVGGLTTLIYYYLKTDNTSDSEDESPSENITKNPVNDQNLSGLNKFTDIGNLNTLPKNPNQKSYLKYINIDETDETYEQSIDFLKKFKDIENTTKNPCLNDETESKIYKAIMRIMIAHDIELISIIDENNP